MSVLAPGANVPRGAGSGIRLQGWLAAVLVVALVAIAGSIGALLMAQVAGRPVTVQLPGQPTTVGANLVSVQGEGRVMVAPDTMWSEVGVEVQRPTVRDALTTARAEADKMTAALQAAGVQAADVQTSSISVYPRIEPNGQANSFTASSMMRVRIRDLNKANATLSAAADAAGNDVRFGSMQFTRTDLTASLAQARQAAISAASSRANEWARLANRQLGKITAVQEQYSGYGPSSGAVSGGGGMGGGGGVPQVQAGQGEAVVVVTVSYALG